MDVSILCQEMNAIDERLRELAVRRNRESAFQTDFYEVSFIHFSSENVVFFMDRGFSSLSLLLNGRRRDGSDV